MDAQELDARRKHCGYDQQALDEAGKKGFDNEVFEFGEEETPEIIEEFYPLATVVVVQKVNAAKYELNQRIAIT